MLSSNLQSLEIFHFSAHSPAQFGRMAQGLKISPSFSISVHTSVTKNKAQICFSFCRRVHTCLSLSHLNLKTSTPLPKLSSLQMLNTIDNYSPECWKTTGLPLSRLCCTIAQSIVLHWQTAGLRQGHSQRTSSSLLWPVGLLGIATECILTRFSTNGCVLKAG